MAMSVAELEQVAAHGWRGLEEEPLGDWVLRSAGGFTGRANSVLAVGDPGMPAADAVARIRTWYAERGLPAMVQVAHPLGETPELDRLLAADGWTIRSGAASVMVADAARIASVGDVEADTEVLARPDEDWLSLYHYRGGALPEVGRRVLESAPWQGFGVVRLDGRTVAIGRVAEHGGWAGLTAIEVAPAHRRRGLAVTVVGALAAAALARGADSLYLQVENTNTPARALYHRLGFTDHHGYHYRVAPAR